jgi:hypothetical protein
MIRQQPDAGAHGAPGHHVAREWGVGGELRAPPSPSRVDLVVLVPQAGGRAVDRIG